ncbi:hypothetical protein LTR62_008333 [Meristemomyces frigidus]|uniref:Apple domain-containing protein n=1 Tax=Meristemomyces frigidus TaxID=1508187 RepID=A0AAN7YNC4_9PEZI|nr:hypothetical protein LTR62_008333 [Meristemomyces frigidus]
MSLRSNTIISAVFSLLSLAAAQSSTTSSTDTSSISASPAPVPAGNFTTCPTTPDALCASAGQTTYCYDDSSELYTLTCNASFTGHIVTDVNDEAKSTSIRKSKRDSFFEFPYVTLADCMSACDARSTCIAVNVINGSSCMLLDTVNGMDISVAGKVAAYKGLWLPNSAIPALNGTNGTNFGGNYTAPANFSFPGNFTLPTNITFPSNFTLYPPNATEPVNGTSTVALPITTDAPLTLDNSTIVDQSNTTATVSSDPTTASVDFPAISANSSSSIDIPPYPANAIRPSGGFAYPTGNPFGPATTGIPTYNSSAPADFPDPSSFPTCDSVACSLAGTPSTPFCHDDQDQLYTVNCGVSFLGATTPLISNSSTTISACTDACDDFQGCQAVNFDLIALNCTLVSGVTGIEFGVPNVVGLWQGYWMQQQPNGTQPGPTGTGAAYPPFGFPTAPVGNGAPSGFPVVSANSTNNATSTLGLVVADPATTSVADSQASSGIPTNSANATGTSGFPTLSVNSTAGVAGPTGTGGYPAGPLPTGYPSFPINSTGAFGNETISACSDDLCQEDDSTTVCTDASGQLYTVNCGLYFEGTIGLNASASSLSGCQATCDGLPRCLAVNYNDGMAECLFVYTVEGILDPAPGWVGAWRGVWEGGAPGGGGNYTGYGGGNYTGYLGGNFTGYPAGNYSGYPAGNYSGYPGPPSGGNFTGNYTEPSGAPVNSANNTATSSDPVATATSDLPVNSANSTITQALPTSTGSIADPVTTSVGTAATSGFPFNSINGSYPAIPTGFIPTGGYPRPPISTGIPSNASFASCSAGACSAYGAVFCTDDQAQLYTLNCGLMYQGTIDISPITAVQADCAAACDGDAACLAYNFGLLNATCDLYSAITGVQYPAPGYIGAWKGYWAGGAPSNASASGLPASGYNGTGPFSPPFGSGLVGTGHSAVPTNSANSTGDISALPTNSANATSSFVADPTDVVSALPTISANATVSSSTDPSSPTTPAATSGFPINSANGSYPAGPTGSLPIGIFPRPPLSTAAPPANLTSCASTSCDAGSAPCTDSTGQLYTLNCGMQFTGPATNTSASSLDACQQVCDAQAGCLGVNFNGYQCQVVSMVTGVQFPAPGWVAAWNGYWAGGAPSAPYPSFNGTGPPAFNYTGPPTFNHTGPPAFNGTGSAPSGLPVNSGNASSPVPSGVPVNSANATSSPPLITDPPSTSSSSPTSLVSADPALNTSSSVTVPSGTATSGFPVNSANGTYPAGPTGFPYPPTNSTTSLCGNGTGTSFIDTAGQLYTINCGLSFQGNVSTSISNPAGLESCADTCDSLPICLGFNYDGATCDFIAAVSGVRFGSPAMVGAWRGAWAGGAPGGGNGSYQGFGGNGSYPGFGGNGSFTYPVGNGSFPVPVGNFSDPSGNTTTPVLNATSSILDPGLVSTTSNFVATIASAGLPTPSANTTLVGTTSSISVGAISTGTVSPSLSINATKSYPLGPISTGSPSPLNSTYPPCSSSGCQAQFCVDAAGSLYSTTCGMAFMGHHLDLPTADPASILDCEASCDASADCIAANYDGACSYISAVYGMVPQNGSIALWKGYWAGGAPTDPSANGTESGFPHGNGTFSGFPGGNSSFSGFPGGPPGGNSSLPGLPGTNETATVNGSVPDASARNTTSSAPISLATSLTTSSSISSTSIAPNTSAPFVEPATTSSVPALASSGFPQPTANSTTGSYTIGPLSTGSPASPNTTVSSCSTIHCSAPYQQTFCQDEAGQTYTITCGVAFTGSVITDSIESRALQSLLECEAACDGDVACIALNYNGPSCSYLSAVTGIQPQNNSMAAWKGLWIGGAPATNGSAPFPLPGPFNGTGPHTGYFPLPSDNASAPAFPTAPVAVSASTTVLASATTAPSAQNSTTVAPVDPTSSVSTPASTSLSSSMISSQTPSASSPSNSTTVVLPSSTASIPMTTGTPPLPVNGSIPPNHTIGSCDAITCFAPYQESFCTDLSGQIYTVTCGIAFQGTPMDPANTPSLLDCEAGCDSSSECVAANYDNGLCTCLSSVTGIQPNNGSVAAWKGIWAGGALTNGSAPYPASFNATGGENGTAPFPPFGLGNFTVPPTTGSISGVSSTVQVSSSLLADPASISASATLSSTGSSVSSSSLTSSSVLSTVPTSTNAFAPVSATSTTVSGVTGPVVPTSSSNVPSAIPSSTASPTESHASPQCSVQPGAACTSSDATFCSDSQNQTWTLTCDSAFNGTVMENQEVLKRQIGAATSTLLDCEAVCDSQSACVALNFANSSCTLLSTINGVNKVSGSIAVYKGYWPQSGPQNGTAPYGGYGNSTNLFGGVPSGSLVPSSGSSDPTLSAVKSVLSSSATRSSVLVTSATTSSHSTGSSSLLAGPTNLSTSTKISSTVSLSSAVSSSPSTSRPASSSTTSATLPISSSISSRVPSSSSVVVSSSHAASETTSSSSRQRIPDYRPPYTHWDPVPRPASTTSSVPVVSISKPVLSASAASSSQLSATHISTSVIVVTSLSSTKPVTLASPSTSASLSPSTSHSISVSASHSSSVISTVSQTPSVAPVTSSHSATVSAASSRPSTTTLADPGTHISSHATSSSQSSSHSSSTSHSSSLSTPASPTSSQAPSASHPGGQSVSTASQASPASNTSSGSTTVGHPTSLSMASGTTGSSLGSAPSATSSPHSTSSTATASGVGGSHTSSALGSAITQSTATSSAQSHNASSDPASPVTHSDTTPTSVSHSSLVQVPSETHPGATLTASTSHSSSSQAVPTTRPVTTAASSTSHGSSVKLPTQSSSTATASTSHSSSGQAIPTTSSATLAAPASSSPAPHPSTHSTLQTSSKPSSTTSSAAPQQTPPPPPASNPWANNNNNNNPWANNNNNNNNPWANNNPWTDNHPQGPPRGPPQGPPQGGRPNFDGPQQGWMAEMFGKLAGFFQSMQQDRGEFPGGRAGPRPPNVGRFGWRE